jgi:hypothetical protein
MNSIEMGYDKAGRHDQSLTVLEGQCIDVLHRRGQGPDAAISAVDLTNRLGLDVAFKNEMTGTRAIRALVNHLITMHGIPIICQAGSGGGYYLTGGVEDTERFYRAFLSRGKTGLVKAARGRKAAYADLTVQYALFDEEEQSDDLKKEKKPFLLPDDGPPVWVRVLTQLLDRAAMNPEKYAEQIRMLQHKYGDIFVPRHKVDELRGKAEEFQRLLKEIAG